VRYFAFPAYLILALYLSVASCATRPPVTPQPIIEYTFTFYMIDGSVWEYIGPMPRPFGEAIIIRHTDGLNQIIPWHRIGTILWPDKLHQSKVFNFNAN